MEDFQYNQVIWPCANPDHGCYIQIVESGGKIFDFLPLESEESEANLR